MQTLHEGDPQARLDLSGKRLAEWRAIAIS
jgi:hypothetical protein